MASPSGRSGEGTTGNEVAVPLADVLQRMIEDAARQQVREALRLQEQEAERRVQETLRQQEQEADRRVQEALRLQEQEAERRLQEALRLQEQRAEAALSEAVRQLEQQLQERDEVIGALRHSLSERMQRLEARVTQIEVGEGEARGGSEEAGGPEGALKQLEAKMGKLEEAVQRALSRVFPRVEALVAQLETPPRAFRAHPPTAASASGAAAAHPLAAGALRATRRAAGGEETERQRMERRIEEVWIMKSRAEANPSSLGEHLCDAAFEGRVEDVCQLLDPDFDVNYISRDGASPLISTFYVEYGWGSANPHVVMMLLERRADVNAIDTSGCTALHYAAISDNCQCVALLIGAGADVNARDEFGVTPLHRAASYGCEAAVRTLLAAGARKSLRCWGGEWMNKTAFEVAETDAIRNLVRP